MASSWSSLELRHLHALVAVADAGTFGRAAEALGYTQSAVSQQVAALERAVGAPVFDRPGGPRPVTLTPVGEVLLERARSVVASLRAAAADVDAIVTGEQGRIRVGTIQSVGTQVLPRLISRLAVERPGVTVELHEAHDPLVLLGMVEDQELDITFCVLPDTTEGPFDHQLVLEDPFVVLAPDTADWRARGSISIDELARLPLIGNRNPTCCGQVLQAFSDDHDPTFVFQSDDNSTIQGCVAAGLGVSLSPLLTIDIDDPTTTVVPLDPPLAPRLVGVAWHRDRRPSALLEAFIDATLTVCRDVTAGWSSDLAA